VSSAEPAPVDAELPEVGPEELLSSALPMSRRGYEPDVIDALLERAAATIERLRAADGTALERQRRSQAEVLQRTLLMAQTTADRTVAEAQTHAASLLDAADRRAQQLMADAEQLATHLVETETARAQVTVGEALARRQALDAEIQELERYVAHARARVRAAFEHEATTLDRLLVEAVGDRPVSPEVDLTDPHLVLPPLGEPSPAWPDPTTPIEARLV